MKKLFNKKKKNLDKFYFGPYVENRMAALHISRKRRNIFFTLTDLYGSVLAAVSAGSFMAKRKKRGSAQVIELIMKKIISTAKMYRIDAFKFFLRLATKLVVKTAVRSVKSRGINVNYAMDLIPVAHNGCRKKKSRRL